MTKVRRKSNGSMKRDVERTRLRLEQQLLESQLDALNFVDPRDAYRGEDGEEWDEVGYGGGYLDEQVEPFRNENELARIRRRARRTVQRNPYAENFLINLVSFVVGKGHTYRVTPKKDEPVSEELVDTLQEYIDDLLKMNKWKKRQKEIYRRMHRDGESFVRIFPQEDGFVKYRFVEPYEVATPRKFSGKKNFSYGIRTEDGDVETVEAYYVLDEEVPYYEMQHRKINVDMNIKRGLSSVWCVLANLDRGQHLLRNMSTVVATQASIALIRKHDASPDKVRNFAANNASFQSVNGGTGETRNFKRLRPATIIDAKKGTEYEFPAVGLNPSAPVEVLGAELRAIASAKSLPEYMVGSDASNANYSSTMVAESPAVRFFEGEQEDMIEADLELINTAIDHAIDVGRLPAKVKELLRIVATSPELVTRDPHSTAQTNAIYLQQRVKSPQTVQGELGLDTDEELENWRQFDDVMYPEMQVDPMAGSEEDDDEDPQDEEDTREEARKKKMGTPKPKKNQSKSRVKRAA
jgi:hypothetical protein